MPQKQQCMGKSAACFRAQALLLLPALADAQSDHDSIALLSCLVRMLSRHLPGGRMSLILACLQGRLCTFYASGYYQVCQRHPEVPRLTARQQAAFAEFERLAGSEELFMQYELQPGDIQVCIA